MIPFFIAAIVITGLLCDIRVKIGMEFRGGIATAKAFAYIFFGLIKIPISANAAVNTTRVKLEISVFGRTFTVDNSKRKTKNKERRTKFPAQAIEVNKAAVKGGLCLSQDAAVNTMLVGAVRIITDCAIRILLDAKHVYIDIFPLFSAKKSIWLYVEGILTLSTTQVIAIMFKNIVKGRKKYGTPD